jgi:hypothetical protein
LLPERLPEVQWCPPSITDMAIMVFPKLLTSSRPDTVCVGDKAPRDYKGGDHAVANHVRPAAAHGCYPV